MSQTQFDLAIVGSGGAAFAAAIHATKLGRSVAMIERATLGGTCVNTGCVPSKALLAAAEARHVAIDAGRFPGITASAGAVDMPALIAGKQALVESMRSEKYAEVAASYGWPIVQGDATFAGTGDAPVLEVARADGTTETVQAEHYLIATGSRPWIPSIPGLAGPDDPQDPSALESLTSTTAMELDEVPESLLVLGGGYVALEQAQLFARLGSRVTMLVRSRLASREEPEASKALIGVFADEGIRVVRRATVDAVRRDEATGEVVATATVSGGTQDFRAARLLVALGRRPVTAGLNLEAVDVKTGELGEIVYVAASHGTMVVDNAFADADRQVDYRHLPRVTFTSPALGSVGMTEAEVLAAGIECDCRVLPLEYVPRALVNRDTRGFVKVVAVAATGQILGLTAVAKDAGELAAAGVYLLEAGMTVDQVAHQWAPYLTMAEGIKIACQSFTTDVSQLSCCAS